VGKAFRLKTNMTKVGIVDITFRKQSFRQKGGISEVVMVQTMPDGSLKES